MDFNIDLVSSEKEDNKPLITTNTELISNLKSTEHNIYKPLTQRLLKGIVKNSSTTWTKSPSRPVSVTTPGFDEECNDPWESQGHLSSECQKELQSLPEYDGQRKLLLEEKSLKEELQFGENIYDNVNYGDDKQRNSNNVHVSRGEGEGSGEGSGEGRRQDGGWG